MKKFFFVAGLFAFSFLGGAVAQTIPFVSVAVAAYQMLSVWTGAAGTAIPTWVSSHYGFNGIDTTSQVSGTPLMSVSPNGRWGAVLASRWSDNTGAGYVSTLNNLCVVDASPTNGTWCQYLQAEVTSSLGTKQMISVENSIYSTQSSPTNIDPFTLNAGGLTNNLRLDCGDGNTSPTPTDCSTALQILNNGVPYTNPAIIIGNSALDTTAMGTNPPAIAMPVGYAYAGYTSAGTVGFKIFGGAGSPAGVVSCTARCMYIRTDGGTGSTLYVNETGGGTSGWAAK